MSMISEQVKELREVATEYDLDDEVEISDLLNQAANTIESLSDKLQAANTGRTAEDCDTEQQYDKIMRINTYLLERYGDKLWEEFGVEKTGDTEEDIFSAMKIFDEIYKREKEKYPLMWYEYCLCGNGKSE